MPNKSAMPVLVKRAKEFLDKSLEVEILNRPKITTPAKLDVIVRTSQLPQDVIEDEKGWKTFTLLADCGYEIEMSVRPRIWSRLVEGAHQWPEWVAVIKGSIEKANSKGFRLTYVGLQVFEKGSVASKSD